MWLERASLFGRYDVPLEPRKTENDDAIILEFEVRDEEKKNLFGTVSVALRQNGEQSDQDDLVATGISREHIRKYVFAFCGKRR